jgi:probable HAF family extracellular repeat protein
VCKSSLSRRSITSLLVALVGLGTLANAQGYKYSITDFGALGTRASKGYGINGSGQVTGEAVTADGQLHAFLFAPGSGLIDLGTLGGGASRGYSINASGQVTGEAVTADGEVHGLLYATV